MHVGTMAALMAVGLLLAACDDPSAAPINAGYCWRLQTDAAGQPSFHPVSTGVRNLESCGANLEAVALRENKSSLAGAYQGQFIFITPNMVQTSMRLKGVRYRLFDADTRAKIDHNLRWMLDDEKHPSKFGPPPAPPR